MRIIEAIAIKILLFLHVCRSYVAGRDQMNKRSTSTGIPRIATSTSIWNKHKRSLLLRAGSDSALQDHEHFEDDSHRFGIRIDASTLTRESFEALYDAKMPVIITNAVTCSSALRKQQTRRTCRNWRELWTVKLQEDYGSHIINYDARVTSDDGLSSHIDTFEATLGEFIQSLAENSDHDDSIYMMDEYILNRGHNSTNPMKLHLLTELFGDDLFQYFPERIRPKEALIVGGVGARSFLHVDPFEWTGWNYLLEGRKLWTFLPPGIDPRRVYARTKEPEAWDIADSTAAGCNDTGNTVTTSSSNSSNSSSSSDAAGEQGHRDNNNNSDINESNSNNNNSNNNTWNKSSNNTISKGMSRLSLSEGRISEVDLYQFRVADSLAQLLYTATGIPGEFNDYGLLTNLWLDRARIQADAEELSDQQLAYLADGCGGAPAAADGMLIEGEEENGSFYALNDNTRNLAVPVFLSGVDEVDSFDPLYHSSIQWGSLQPDVGESGQEEKDQEQQQQQQQQQQQMVDLFTHEFNEVCGASMQIVQEEGDLILIPPNCWHQVYHLEPSIAVAGQYCNRANKRRVFSHILKHCGVLQVPPDADGKKRKSPSITAITTENDDGHDSSSGDDDTLSTGNTYPQPQTIEKEKDVEKDEEEDKSSDGNCDESISFSDSAITLSNLAQLYQAYPPPSSSASLYSTDVHCLVDTASFQRLSDAAQVKFVLKKAILAKYGTARGREFIKALNC